MVFINILETGVAHIYPTIKIKKKIEKALTGVSPLHARFHLIASPQKKQKRTGSGASRHCYL